MLLTFSSLLAALAVLAAAPFATAQPLGNQTAGNQTSRNVTTCSDKTLASALLSRSGGGACVPSNLTRSCADKRLSLLLSYSMLYPSSMVMDITMSPNASITLLAPTNQAIKNLVNITGASAFQAVLDSSIALQEVISYHTFAGAYNTSDLLQGVSLVPTMRGLAYPLTVNKTGENITVNGANVIEKNVKAGNSFIQVIDRVLLPPSLPLPTIASVVARYPELSMLYSYVAKYANSSVLALALNASSVTTVLAPTNAAFAAGDQMVLQRVLGNSTLLSAFLRYHIIPGTYMSNQIVAGPSRFTTATSLYQNNMSVSYNSTGGYINMYAKIIKVDIIAGASVVHTIDKVLIPPNLVF